MGTTANVLEKLRGLDAPKMLAVVDLFGSRENLEACLRGEKKMTLEDVIRKLVDHTGRLIPAHLGITCAVCDENRNFHIQQPTINYGEILARYTEFFPKGTLFLSAAEFEDRAEAGKERLVQDNMTSDLVKRVHMPLLLPHYAVSEYGTSMQNFFLLAVKNAYKADFPDREFINYRDGELAKQVSVIPNTGHDRFLAMMAEGPGMAWYFPNPMQGFSVLAQREAMNMLLSRGFTLTGAIEPTLGFVGYSKEMARDYNTPGFDCPAVSFRSSSFSLSFWADGGPLEFGRSDYLDCADDGYSGGVVFLG